jgi:hypothetical protein
MYSRKMRVCVGECRRIGALRSLLVLVVVLFDADAIEAQIYNRKPVQIQGSGLLSGIQFHSVQPGNSTAVSTGPVSWAPTQLGFAGTENAASESVFLGLCSP